MDEKQLLDAIQSIVQNVVQKETSELREELRGEMETRFAKSSKETEARFGTIEDLFVRQSSEAKALHENTFDRIKNLLHEDYERIAGAAAKGAAVAESHNELQSTVNTHEKVLQNHNERLSMLEEKAI